MKKIVIVGGGAGGIAAALSAAKSNPDAHVMILEGLDRVGKKILATGNGHCNLTNEYIDEKCYHSKNKELLKAYIEKMPSSMSIEFFEELGLYSSSDDAGRVYPYCRQATMVLDILLLALKRYGIDVRCEQKVSDISFKNNMFYVRTKSGEEYKADRVIITTGGKAAPKQGSDGSGYALAEKFGHKYNYLFPSLVPLQCKGNVFKGLKGIRVLCRTDLFVDGKKTASERGELQLTDYGVSGIPAMQLSCFLEKNASNGKAQVGIDFFPDMNYEELRKIVFDRIRIYPKETLENIFLGLINKRVLFAMLKYLSIEPLSRTADSLTKKETDLLVSTLKMWKFEVTGTLSWDFAQVTGGGIKLEEIDENFESVYRKGLYIAGEILDVTGDCGGYNLHWAWCSGIMAGRSAALNEYFLQVKNGY